MWQNEGELELIRGVTAMRRFARFASYLILAFLTFAVLTIATGFVVHRIQLVRLRRLAARSSSEYVKSDEPYFVLRNIRIVDGTGSEERVGQSIVVRDGKITWSGRTSEMPSQSGARILDFGDATVIPGLVMMHEHLFLSAAGMKPELTQQSITFPLLYLASGVTTARTAGSIDPDADLRVKREIDSGAKVGPELFLTAPYLEGAPPLFPQMHTLTGPEDAQQMVNKYFSEGFTSFKAYADITPDELQAAITAAHLKSAKITGHLCTITFTQAADMGIDNLEHGLLADTEFYSGKKPNECPPIGRYLSEYRDKLDVASPAVLAVIDRLVAHHVALTSTLAVFESELGAPVPEWYQQRENSALTWQSWISARAKQRMVKQHHAAGLLRKAEQYELEFVRRGGTLLAGADPTGDGSTLAGLADLRELELLVEAGFTPVQALQIATQNGAAFLGIADRAGTLEVGKQADLVVIDGDPAKDITAIRNIRTVYRLGVGYDPQKILRDIHGIVGLPN